MAKDQMTVTDAANSGDRVETLKALRARLAETIDDPVTPPRDLAALSRQLTQVLSALADDEKPEGSDLDDLIDGDTDT